MHTAVKNEQGFSLLEIMMVVAVTGTVAAMAALVSPSFIRHQKAEAGISQALEVIRNARETAISQRRNVRIVFNGSNVIQTVRENICTPSPCSAAAAVLFLAGTTGTTTLRTVQLENRMEFLRVAPNDTPDAFGGSPAGAAVAFGLTATRMFTSEGTLVNANGDPLNGTLFLAIPNQPNSARAVTIFGVTALLRTWRWDGGRWVE
jgi:prepilin-type N-terminal cleavage/methylation domain-containing protein